MFCKNASLSCASHSIDICTVAIKNIRNVHAVSTNQIADILHFNDKKLYILLKDDFDCVQVILLKVNFSKKYKSSLGKVTLKIS